MSETSEERRQGLAEWYRLRREILTDMTRTAARIVGLTWATGTRELKELTAEDFVEDYHEARACGLDDVERTRWYAVAPDQATFERWQWAARSLATAADKLPDAPDKRPRGLWGPVLLSEPSRVVLTCNRARSSTMLVASEVQEDATLRVCWPTTESGEPRDMPPEWTTFSHLIEVKQIPGDKDVYLCINTRSLLQHLGLETARLTEETGNRHVARVLDAAGIEQRHRLQVIGVLTGTPPVLPQLGGSTIERADRRQDQVWKWCRFRLFLE